MVIVKTKQPITVKSSTGEVFINPVDGNEGSACIDDAVIEISYVDNSKDAKSNQKTDEPMELKSNEEGCSELGSWVIP